MRGQGVGGMRRSLYSKLVPIAKNTGEKLLSTTAAEETLRTVRNSAIDAGLNMVTDKVGQSRTAKGGSRKDIAPARKLEFAAAAAAAQPNHRKAGKRAAAAARGGGKARRVESDIFDDDTLEDNLEIN